MNGIVVHTHEHAFLNSYSPTHLNRRLTWFQFTAAAKNGALGKQKRRRSQRHPWICNHTFDILSKTRNKGLSPGDFLRRPLATMGTEPSVSDCHIQQLPSLTVELHGLP